MALIKREYTDHETVVTAENMNAIQDSIIALEDGLFSVDNDKSGEIITITDASKRGLQSLNIYGKTTQDGIPTPEAPAALVSPGAGGGILARVCGKNLLDVSRLVLGEPTIMARTTTGFVFTRGEFSGGTYASFAMPILKGQTITFSCKGSAYQPTLIIYKDAMYGTQLKSSTTMSVLTYTAAENIRAAVFAVIINSKNTDCEVSDIQIELGSTATSYEPYTGQTISVSSHNGLRGIPVASGGNYTDANGQQWICDEVDFARGVYVQRCGEIVIDGTNIAIGQHGNLQHFCKQSVSNIIKLGAGASKMVLSDRYEASSWTDQNNKAYCIGEAIVLTDNRFTDKDTTVAILQAETPHIVYVLDTPIETNLSEEELAAYAALHTYKDHTTVSNDAGAWMDLEYVMDAKKYIDYLVAAPMPRLASVTLSSASWVGADNLYSQVVAIGGITEYSKVDLLPSVEQLAIFHNKDVAFVTENENGVVTVFAIGDKPTNDYTMQVQITEVVA